MPYPKYTTQRTGSNLAFSGYSWNWLMMNVPLLKGGQPCVVSFMGSDETTPASKGDRPSTIVFTVRRDIVTTKGPMPDSIANKNQKNVMRDRLPTERLLSSLSRRAQVRCNVLICK